MHLFNSAAEGCNSPDHKPQQTPWPSQGAEGEGQASQTRSRTSSYGWFLGTKNGFYKNVNDPRLCGTSLLGEDKSEDRRRKKDLLKVAAPVPETDCKMLVFLGSGGGNDYQGLEQAEFQCGTERQPENPIPSSS